MSGLFDRRPVLDSEYSLHVYVMALTLDRVFLNPQ